MRVCTAIALALAVLSSGTGSALAFQEEPGAPPPGAAQMLPEASDPSLALQTPQANPAEPAEKGGAGVFGFDVLPKLNFGLELLYSQQPMELQDTGGTITDEESDVSVVGKIKRRF